ncbi:hypothetical protein AB0K48_58050, partial [Nonomuraea sp. NPDC055795]
MVDKADQMLLGFKRHLRVDVVAGEAVYVSSARGTTALEGALVHRLAPMLDGTRTVAEIRHAMAPWASAPRLGHMLAQLTQANLVGFQSASTTEADAYWDLAGLDQAGLKAAATPVAVITLDDGPQAAAEAC